MKKVDKKGRGFPCVLFLRVRSGVVFVRGVVFCGRVFDGGKFLQGRGATMVSMLVGSPKTCGKKSIIENIEFIAC